MEMEFIARSTKKAPLDVSQKIIEVKTIRANEETITDIQEVIQLLKALDYTIDN